MIAGINPRRRVGCQTGVARADHLRAPAACTTLLAVGNHASHTMPPHPTLVPELGFPRARCLHMCRRRAAQAPRGARGARMVPVSRERSEPGTSALCRRPALAMPTQASRTSTSLPNIPHSPCAPPRLPDSPRSESTCCPASHDVSEHSETIYYRPLPRPQPSAPSRTRCADAVVDRAMAPLHTVLPLLLECIGGSSSGDRSSRSGRPAAAPSPPVRGPSACTRAPAAAAIWRRVVLPHAHSS